MTTYQPQEVEENAEGYPSSWDDDLDDIAIGDLSAVSSSDVIDTARKVMFEIRKAEFDVQQYSLDEGGELKKWAKKNLKLQLAVGPLGIDGEGKYAGKVFFSRVLLQVNKDDFADAFEYEKYDKNGKAWRPIKQFWTAMGGDAKDVMITKDWILSLAGQSVIADIIKRAQRQQINGEWVNGEMQNDIENFRRAVADEAE